LFIPGKGREKIYLNSGVDGVSEVDGQTTIYQVGGPGTKGFQVLIHAFRYRAAGHTGANRV
jgi:hypothetical protein